MPVKFNTGGGGGVSSSDVTVTRAYVHPDYSTITKDSNDEVVPGTMKVIAAKTYTPGTKNITIAANQYLNGVQTIKGDANLVPENIKEGVSIFGISGALGALVKKSNLKFYEGNPSEGGYEGAGAASTENYAIYAGGNEAYDSIITKQAIAYNKNLVRTTAPNLSTARSSPMSAKAGSMALFASGYINMEYSSSSHLAKTVEAYNDSLVRSSPSASMSIGKAHGAAASVGDYALFAGGENLNNIYNTVEAYNSKLVKSTATAIRLKTNDISGASVGNHALFCGYYDSNKEMESDYVDTYNESLVKGTATVLSEPYASPNSASTEEAAIFCLYDNFNAYESNLARKVIPIPSNFESSATLCGVRGRLICAGGGRRSEPVNNVLTCDSSFVFSEGTSLSEAKLSMIPAKVGNVALFASGSKGTKNGYSNIVETYEVNY